MTGGPIVVKTNKAMIASLPADGQNYFASVEHTQPVNVQGVRSKVVHARKQRVSPKDHAKSEQARREPVRVKSCVIGKCPEYRRAIHPDNARHQHGGLIFGRLIGAT